MEAGATAERDRITIAIMALGGQGGGVLADWILDLANSNGFIAQGTSVPGVAQRTGSTIYYIEMVRRAAAYANRPAPVLAMMPVPGDVDIVIASELMEAGRAILRGFVSGDRTTLIGSTHRVYAISEKAALGDGIGSSQRILDAARRRSARFIGFDMEATAVSAGSVISSIMFGALAGSGALPFSRAMFEQAVRHGGKAVQANLRGLESGAAQATIAHHETNQTFAAAGPTSPAGHALKSRIVATLPASIQPLAIEGVRKLMDYQDRAYAELYLDRIAEILARDDGADDWRLTRQTARHLALWMAYEDTIRVADLKIRGARTARVQQEVRLGQGQVMTVTEYMHPRLQELCDVMPAAMGDFILARSWLSKLVQPMFAKGRHVRTTSLRWYVALWLVAALRGRRRSTRRYRDEQARIAAWLDFISDAAARDSRFAAEIVEAQRLIKGYSDTFDRGLARFEAVVAEARSLLGRPDGAAQVALLRDAALADESGTAFAEALAAVRRAA
ncbi:indolepyruvate oxidoreductase subunit beta family protein [Sphingomonas sp.]|uniref:indolepyruvate oxidoreductase subunit beta family protein n=1 Tax=Sphingomonas sp. TaxID=28214 RepID=UPI003B3BC3BB